MNPKSQPNQLTNTAQLQQVNNMPDATQSQRQNSATSSALSKNSSLMKLYKEHKTAAIILLIILIILVESVVSYKILFTKKTTNPNHTISYPGFLSNTPTPTNTPPISTASALGYTINVLKVIPNPHVVGDPPNKGLQYLEIDLSVTYAGNKPDYVPGVFYYQDASDNLISSADVQDGGVYSNKNVVIPGKKNIYSAGLNSGQTVNGLYLIYQVNPRDRGSLGWYYFFAPQTGYKHIFLKLY